MINNFIFKQITMFHKTVRLAVNRPSIYIFDYLNQFRKELEECLYGTQSKQQKNEQLKVLQSKIVENLFQSQKQFSVIQKQLRDPSCPPEERDELVLQLTQYDIKSRRVFALGLDEAALGRSVALSMDDILTQIIKDNIVEKERRVDLRKLNETRAITVQAGVLPMTHGSSLFQRGETQVLNVLTLAGTDAYQALDGIEDFEDTQVKKTYLHHYNFPPYSVGETGRYIGPGRREIGHGALAEKALRPVLPTEEEFPYVIRTVSECLGSNGSTSMASTCASTLSLMDGGVPIKDMVAGVAMGLALKNNDQTKYLIFDFDGVLGDTFELFIETDSKIHGISKQEAADKLIQVFEKTTHSLQDNVTDEKYQQAKAYLNQLFGELKGKKIELFNNFIREIAKINNVKLAIVTTGYKSAWLEDLNQTDLRFSHILDFDDHYSKEIKIGRICQDWGVSNTDVYYFTDTKSDVLELQNYMDKSKIIGCHWGFHGKDKLSEVLPENQILDNFHDIHNLFQSKFRVLTDIQGLEDHHADMDFKVTGTRQGVTAIQLDNKVGGLTAKILSTALFEARIARLHILDKMTQVIDTPRQEISRYAPRCMVLTVPQDKIRDVIGSGGAMIHGLEQEYEVEISLDNQSGKCAIYGKDATKVEDCYRKIAALIREFKKGDVITGRVFRIEAYGAFIRIDDSEKDALIHISQMGNGKMVKTVEEIMKIGDRVECEIQGSNEKGQLNLNFKSILT